MLAEGSQNSFPIKAGSANRNSPLLFSLTAGSLDWNSFSRPELQCILGTSSPILLLYLCGIVTVNGSPLPASRACPAPVREGFIRVCEEGIGFFVTAGDAKLNGAGVLRLSESRLMFSQPSGSGAGGGGENGLITGDGRFDRDAPT